jgi:predicted ATPase
MCSRTGHPLGSHPAAYTKLLAQLARAGWVCRGTVVCRTLRRKVGGQRVEKGPYYLWTDKRQGKTISHALSRGQYQVVKQAIKRNRRVMRVLAKLQAITLEEILKKVSGVTKRK